MRWRKLGHIFNPIEHILPNNCVDFAQGPHGLEFDDFVRIYFSARAKDDTGKYLSHVAYADFDKEFKKLLNVSSKTVIPLGKRGTFDEHGIFPFAPFRDGDRILGYTSGWTRRVNVSVDTGIGISESFDGGETFVRMGDGPIVTASLNEPFLVCDPFVLKVDDLYYMWYIYGTDWLEDKKLSAVPERVYKIGYAVSKDGVSWEKQNCSQLIEDVLGETECQALPSIFFYNGKYHMYFCYREAFNFREDNSKAYRIGYAYSEDLENWVRNDKQRGIEFSETGWDSEMIGYQKIFECNHKIYMAYNGNNFGKYGFGIAMLENDKK